MCPSTPAAPAAACPRWCCFPQPVLLTTPLLLARPLLPFAPLLYLLLTLLAAAAVLARGEMYRFLFLFLSPPPVEVYWPWCCTGTPQCTKLARLCNTGAFLPLLYWCVERLSFVLKLNLATAYFCPLSGLNDPPCKQRPPKSNTRACFY